MMDTLLVKIFATALTFSQVVSTPDALKTHFDPTEDRQRVMDLLRAGCEQVRKDLDVESINLDDLIATAMEDPEATAGEHAAVFRGIKIEDLHTAYRRFCKKETVLNSPVDLGEVIEFYNRTLADLPDHSHLRDVTLSGASIVLDNKGNKLSEVFSQEQRRISVALAEVPAHVQNAFVSAEDKRFYQHNGIDEHSVIRAFTENLSQSGRLQGGSTITQQVVKNLLVGEEVTYERKIREMILASRVEHTFTKPQILELYLNSIFLGRGSWGVEMAARSYFGKSANTLTVSEGALLAALAKGPTYFNPDRHPDRLKERLSYVLRRMQEDGAITTEDAKAASPLATLVHYVPPRSAGSYFTDFVAREIRRASDLPALRSRFMTVHSTLNPDIQRAVENALQEGLARYERDEQRVNFHGPETNLAAEVDRLNAEAPVVESTWQQALESARIPLSDVHWDPVVVIGKADRKNREGSLQAGLADGGIVPLTGPTAILRSLKPYDVVLVHVADRKGRAARAELRVRPQVQGAAIVLENKTGRILAMAGGFSYASSQLNRLTQSQRQPGSALKPLTYLVALQKGLQPNTLVRDEGITFPPINRGKREEDYWSPKNYDGKSSGLITLRQALEDSRNQATASLLRGIEVKPELSLDRICGLALELQIYKDCDRFYPFVLGAEPVRPIDLAAFYATIANDGARPVPYAIDAIEESGKIVYRHQPSTIPAASADPASFYQLKTMLQGVVQRGTAHAISDLAPYVAGKTGTTEDENDAWFVGFTNDVTVAVWVGYDNGDGRRHTLGTGQTGAHVALPIFGSIIESVWEHGSAKSPLNPPSPEASRLLVSEHAAHARRDRSRGRAGGEFFRKDANGAALDTRYALLSHEDVDEAHEGHTRHRFSDRAERAESVPRRRGSGEARAWREQRGQWNLFGAPQTGGWRESQPGGWHDLSPGLREMTSGARRDFSPGWRGSPSTARPFGARDTGSFGYMFGRW
jgi:1A family penicillin-binding protein